MIARRTVLGLLGAAASMATISGTSRAAKRPQPSWPPPDLGNRQELLHVYRKLAYSLDETVTFWWMRGTRYGLVDTVTTPFWDMHIGAWLRTRDLDEGSYEVTMASANFYTPPDSTELLEVFQNPYTGKQVPINYHAPRARRNVMGPDGSSPFGGVPGMTTTDRSTDKGPGWIEGEDVVVRGDSMLRAVPTDAGPDARPFVVNDWSTYVGSLAEVSNPGVKNPASVQYFNDILSWPEWLQMGDHPGNYVSRCFGRKVFAYDQMPAVWRQLFERALPESAKDPYGVLDDA